MIQKESAFGFSAKDKHLKPEARFSSWLRGVVGEKYVI